MTKIEDSIEIKADPERMSQYLMDVNNLPSYFPISDIEVLEGKEEATKFRHKFTAMGRTMETVCQTETVEKNKKMTFRTLEGMKIEGTWLLEPTETGTKLSLTVEYQPPGWIFGVIFDKLKMQKEMRRIYAGGLQKLSETLGA
jgi:uncharacterized membrane protein